MGMDFEDISENSGREVNLGLKDLKFAKVRQRNLVGNNGVIIKKKVDIYYIDCIVTGSNYLTSKGP